MKFGSTSSDYLTYKKSKMNPTRVQRVEKRVEKIRRILKLSFVTFCIMFICVVIFIKKYAKRIDIEYGRHGAEISKNSDNSAINDNYFNETYDSDKRTIDKRLILIQEEENAPSESRVLPQDRDKNEVMNLEHFEKLKSMDEEFEDFDKPVQDNVQKPVNSPQAASAQKPAEINANLPANTTAGSDLNVEAQGNFAPIELAPKANIKVLIGRYSTFDEAKNAQANIKNVKKIAPFVRKIDNVYCLQIGSYTSMDVARSVAGSYNKDGFDVWIYQQ